MKDDDSEYYVTVYRPICGWKAVLMGPNGPECTSFGGHKTPAEAQVVAEEWGRAEGYPVRQHTFGECPKHGQQVVDGRCDECSSIEFRENIAKLKAKRERK